MSLATSRKQIPASAKRLHRYLRTSFDDLKHVINYGCGKWEELTEAYWQEKYPNLTTRIHYDPNALKAGICVYIPDGYTTDLVFCANVLNVLDDDLLEPVLKHIASLNFKFAIFQIYEGDQLGHGRPTRDGYQRNEKTAMYLPRILPHFDSHRVEVMGQVILLLPLVSNDHV